MPDYSVGFFIVPAAYLDDLRNVEDQARQAFDTNQPDQFWRLNQIFHRAHEAAVVAVVVTGENEPIYNDGRDTAYIHLSLWLQKSLLDGSTRDVLDTEQFAKLALRLRRITQDEFLRWSAKHASKYGEVDTALLVELFDALQRAIRATPAGTYGFVYRTFRHEDRDPPPEPDEPEDTMTAQDGAKQKEMMERRLQARISRERREWWVDSPHHSRILIGMVAPERAAELDSEYCAARALLSDGKILAGLAAMNSDVVPHVEKALLDPIIEIKEGPVRVHAWLQIELNWDTNQQPRAVSNPKQASDLDQLLDQRDENELIESIWEMEIHWTRDLIREVYRRFRATLKRAIEQGYGFAWLYDRNE